jgi:site-specific DNA-adenine methylase
MTQELVAPFPQFGGKRRIVDITWPRLGVDVNTYLEPFAASLAMLLGRPGGAGKYETVNDIDSHISNFWRSVRADPMEVARYADYPVIEIDVHARHKYLVAAIPKLAEKLEADPDYFDPKLAGFWVWGKSAWIGDGWCQHPDWRARPDITGRNGVHALAKQLPDIAVRRGIHKKIPNLHGDRGVHTDTSAGIYERMMALAERLRHVRVCSGDWKRILSSSSMGTNASGVAQGIAPAAIYLDPPYKGYEHIYGVEQTTLHEDVRDFCLEYGEHPRVRIALSGYEGEYELPGWEVVEWKAHGGYANQAKSHENENAHRERIWFSPSCLPIVRERTLHDVIKSYRT